MGSLFREGGLAMPVVARMTPELVYRPLTGEWPLLYQLWIPGNREPFKLEGKSPLGEDWWKLDLPDQLVGGELVKTLAGNPISCRTPGADDGE